MNKLKNILNRVNNIISNSNNDTLDEIKNISDILEVDGKIATILHFAHRQIESITMDREAMHLRDSLIPKYAQLVYNGFWFAPEREALQALVENTQMNVTGTVRVKLYKGGLYTAGRKSSVSLYNPALATMEADPTQAYDQGDATGFIRLNALRLKVDASVKNSKRR